MRLSRLPRPPAISVLLSLLAFLLLLRGTERADALRSQIRDRADRHWWTGLFPFLACLGALILLAGLFIGNRWGWREEGLIGPEPPLFPSRTGGTPGLYHTGFGPSLTVRATDATNRPLKLQQTAREAAQTELVLYLTPSAPESAFAIPESSLVVRLGVRGDFSAQSPILVEVFRAPSGERVQETTMEQSPSRLTADGIVLEIVRRPYPLMAAVYDPGLGLKWVGLTLGSIGLVGTLRPGGRRERVSGLLLSILTLLVAGLAGYGLATRGALGALPFQLEVSALWLAGLGVWLIRQKEG